MALPVYESHSGDDDLTIPAPSGVTATDTVMVLTYMATLSDTNPGITLSGFTQRAYNRNFTGTYYLHFCVFDNNGADLSAVASYTLAGSGSIGGGGVATRLSGSGGWDSEAVGEGGGVGYAFKAVNVANATETAYPVITTTEDDCMAFGLIAHAAGDSTVNAPWVDYGSTGNAGRTARLPMETAGATTGTATPSTSSERYYFVTAYKGISEATTVSATGSISGTATLAGAGHKELLRTASITGLATLSGAGHKIVATTGSISGTGTLSASSASLGVVSATGSITGTSTLSASGIEVISRTASIAGSATLSGAGISIVSATASISGTGTLSGAGESVTVTAPGAPTNVRPSDAFGYDSEVAITWTAPSNDGGGTITGYRIRYSIDFGDNWTTYTADTGTSTVSATLTGLTLNQRYDFEIAAINSAGTGTAAESEWGCTPVLASAPQTPPSASPESVAGIEHLDRHDKRTLAETDGTMTRHWDGTGVVVYVLDSGIRATHDEFDGRLGTGYSFNEATYPWDEDGEGHGTGCASIAAGNTRGVANGATIVMLRSWVTETPGSPADAVGPLEWVRDNHDTNYPGQAAVVTSSTYFGASDVEGGDVNMAAANAVVDDLIDVGIPFVMIAGNTSEAYDPIQLDARPGLIIVGGIEDDDNVWTTTRLTDGGPIDVFAQAVGVDRATITSDSSYTGSGSGTSYAGPQVAGAVACWLQANSTLTPAQVHDLVAASSTKDEINGNLQGHPNRILYHHADIPPVVSTVTATGSISGAATLTAVGIEELARTASMSGAGTISAVGVRIVSSTGSTSSTGTLSGAGVRIETSAASLSGVAALAATGTRIASATGSIAGAGTLTAAGEKSNSLIDATGSISGTATLAASGVRIVSTTAIIEGDGTLTADGVRIESTSATLSSTATLVATGTRIASATGSLEGDGTLTATGIEEIGRTGSLEGDGSLAASGSAIVGRAGSIEGEGTLSAIGNASGTSSATISGTSTLTASGMKEALRTGALEGTSTLSATETRIAPSTGSLSSEAAIAGQGLRIVSATGSISGTGTLTGSNSAVKSATGTISGTGSITGAGDFARTRSGTIEGTSTLAGVGVRVVSSTASLSGTSTISGSATGAVERTGTVEGTGSIAATGVRIVVSGGSISGSSTMSAAKTRVAVATASIAGSATLSGDRLRVAIVSGSLSGAGDLSGTSIKIVGKTGSISGTGTLVATVPAQVDFDALKTMGWIEKQGSTYKSQSGTIHSSGSSYKSRGW